MNKLVLLLGVFVVVIGAVGIVAPDTLVAIGRYSVTPVGLLVVGTLRIGIGVLLIAASRASRAPMTLRVLGIIALVGGVATFLLGTDRATAILDWSSAQGGAFVRVGALLALAFGSFIVFAVRPTHDSRTS